MSTFKMFYTNMNILVIKQTKEYHTDNKLTKKIIKQPSIEIKKDVGMALVYTKYTYKVAVITQHHSHITMHSYRSSCKLQLAEFSTLCRDVYLGMVLCY